ncbi:hypothetical protein [Streptomyces sp. cmx-4-9]|uniref:hypothetical protein n=1 Tax=Streptomyces sp. cmx-4-9 TaxID=2790941 RepID=UPI0039804FB0
MPEPRPSTHRTHAPSLLGAQPPQDGQGPPLTWSGGSAPRASHRALPAGDYWFPDDSRGGHLARPGHRTG